jgi:hypothetical protein
MARGPYPVGTTEWVESVVVLTVESGDEIEVAPAYDSVEDAEAHAKSLIGGNFGRPKRKVEVVTRRMSLDVKHLTRYEVGE